jgi:hypothetical protein
LRHGLPCNAAYHTIAARQPRNRTSVATVRELRMPIRNEQIRSRKVSHDDWKQRTHDRSSGRCYGSDRLPRAGGAGLQHNFDGGQQHRRRANRGRRRHGRRLLRRRERESHPIHGRRAQRGRPLLHQPRRSRSVRTRGDVVGDRVTRWHSSRAATASCGICSVTVASSRDGSSLGGQVVWNPSAVALGENHLIAFVRGTDKALWYREYATAPGCRTFRSVAFSPPDQLQYVRMELVAGPRHSARWCAVGAGSRGDHCGWADGLRARPGHVRRGRRARHLAAHLAPRKLDLVRLAIALGPFFPPSANNPEATAPCSRVVVARR